MADCLEVCLVHLLEHGAGMKAVLLAPCATVSQNSKLPFARPTCCQLRKPFSGHWPVHILLGSWARALFCMYKYLSFLPSIFLSYPNYRVYWSIYGCFPAFALPTFSERIAGWRKAKQGVEMKAGLISPFSVCTLSLQLAALQGSFQESPTGPYYSGITAGVYLGCLT